MNYESALILTTDLLKRFNPLHTIVRQCPSPYRCILLWFIFEFDINDRFYKSGISVTTYMELTVVHIFFIPTNINK